MGTVLSITVHHADAKRAAALAAAAVDVARHWDDVLTTWRTEGELARLNARAGDGFLPVSDDLHAAIESMRRLSRETGGAFDPAVGAQVRRLRDSDDDTTRPQERRILRHVDVRPGMVRLRAGTELDSGGIGKGIALDAMATFLRKAGVESTFLDFGGSSQLALGVPPSEPQGWSVLITGQDDALGVLHLHDHALSSSRAGPDSDDGGMIVDPDSGEPIRSSRLATVVAPDATTAEGWSTALIVRGRAGIPAAIEAGLDVLYQDPEGIVRTGSFREAEMHGSGEGQRGAAPEETGAAQAPSNP